MSAGGPEGTRLCYSFLDHKSFGKHTYHEKSTWYNKLLMHIVDSMVQWVGVLSLLRP